MMKKSILSVCSLFLTVLSSLSGCALICEHKGYNEEVRVMINHYCQARCPHRVSAPDDRLKNKLRCMNEEATTKGY